MGMKSERTVLMITGHSIGRNAQSSWSINVWTVHQRDFHETQPGQDAAAIETLLITLGQIWCPAEIWWFDDFNLSLTPLIGWRWKSVYAIHTWKRRSDPAQPKDAKQLGKRSPHKETPNLDDKHLPETMNMNPENTLPVLGAILHTKRETVSEKYCAHGFPGALLLCFIHWG